MPLECGAPGPPDASRVRARQDRRYLTGTAAPGPLDVPRVPAR